MAQIIIVDEKDEVIGHKERNAVERTDIYRASALWLENSRGEVLLAQRALIKSHHPGKWGPAVAGTVEKGETYDSNIRKESAEEIGLENCRFEKIQKVRVARARNYFCQWYRAVLDRKIAEFTIDPVEVRQIAWFSKKKLADLIEVEPDQFLISVKEFLPTK